MKRHIQQPGVRQWAGEDLIELQAEPLKAIDGFFSAYGPCILQGCQVIDNGNGTYNISSGLLALSGTDVGGNNTFKVVPFSGVSNVPLPVYFTLAYSVIERSYLDGQVKPIAYNYRAEVSTVEPTSDYLELSEDYILRFVDVIQCDAEHRFFTDTERQKLKGIDAGANKYVHPVTHPASMIAEDSTHKFMTSNEKSILSTLNDSYATSDFSNITNKSLGQNGYYKLPDGILIQWGFINTMTTNALVLFPVAFLDNNWSISVLSNGSLSGAILSPMLHSKFTTYFKINHLYMNEDGTIGRAGEGIHWIAIGRWK